MGKTNDNNEESVGTIFDDVFRTMAEKFPSMFVALINEFFHTDYPYDVPCVELKNEHYTKAGKIITDALFDIGGHLYHLECQSKKDGQMVIRMFQYDVSIALEHAEETEDGLTIHFPASCVLYVRNHRSLSENHVLRVIFPDGQTMSYQVPVKQVSNYSLDEIFTRRLYALLPFYVLRYENFFKSNSADVRKTERFILELKEMCSLLGKGTVNESTYVDLLGLIKEILMYIIPSGNHLKGKVDDIMGGKVLELESERLRREGRAEGRTEGRAEGRAEEIFQSVLEGDYDAARGADKLGIPVSDFLDRMKAAGYRIVSADSQNL